MTLSLQGEKFRERCGLSAEALAEVLTMSPCPPHLVLGVIHTESGGNPDALRYEPNYPYLHHPEVSAEMFGWTTKTEEALQRFSYGLMQIMLATARELGFALHPKILFVPKTNVAWGAHYLHELKRRHGNWQDAVAAYNYGHPARKFIGGAYKNQGYVDKVFEASGRFEKVGS